MAEKSDIPRASASLRSITPMVRITGGPGVDSAPMRAWTYIMLVPPGKEEHRAASYGSRCDHAVPRPEPILTQEVQWDQEMFWTCPFQKSYPDVMMVQPASPRLEHVDDEHSERMQDCKHDPDHA